jgi:hypothetical protein
MADVAARGGEIRAAIVGDSAATDATRTALEQQSRRVPEIRAAATLSEALAAARAAGAEWLWVLEPGTRPRQDALEHLVDVLERPTPLPPPVLLASRIITPEGELDRAATPVLDVRRIPLVTDAFEHGLIPLRVARGGSLLVNTRALEGSKSHRYELVWIARLLRSATGVLVPASVVVRDQPSSSAVLDVRGTIALLVSAALAPYEKPWFAFRFVEDALAEARRVARAGSRRGLLRSGGA